MEKEKIKNGFTLVELLVVIAILATLTSVSIISYSSFIKKAHISNDITYVSQLNNILNASRQIDKENISMSEAINDLDEEDVSILKIQTKNYFISWSKENDLFALLDVNKNIVYPSFIKNNPNDLFLLINDIKEIDNSSLYNYCLSNLYTYEELEIEKSIDIGINKNVKKVIFNMENSNDYYLYTNNEELSIDVISKGNDSSSLSHYGIAKNVNLQIYETSTYKEYGSLYSAIDSIIIDKGNLMIDKNSKVTNMYLKAADKNSYNITLPYKEIVIYVDSSDIINKNKINIHDLVTIVLRNTVIRNIDTNKDYTSIKDALNDGGNLLLLKDVELNNDETLFINKPTTINFYGHSVVGYNKCNKDNNFGIFKILSENVVFNDSSFNKGEIINRYDSDGTLNSCTIFIGEDKNKNYSLTINDNLKIISKCNSTINVNEGNCKLIINNASLTSDHFGINFEKTNNESEIVINNITINAKSKCFNYINCNNLKVNEATLSFDDIRYNKAIDQLITNKKIEIYNDCFKIVKDIQAIFIAKTNLLNNDIYLVEGNLEKIIELDNDAKSITIDVEKDCNINLSRFGSEDNNNERILKINVLNDSTINGTISLRVATLYINYHDNLLKIKSEGGYTLTTNEDNIKYISRKN